MADIKQRIRTVKPSLFNHDSLFDAEHESSLPVRLSFIGLFTVADREGRFVWNPRRLKPMILPYDEIDFSTVMDVLERYGFIKRYEVGNQIYGYIPTFLEHQSINQRESASTLPDPSDISDNKQKNLVRDDSTCTHMHAHGEGNRREQNRREGNGKGTEGKGASHATQAGRLVESALAHCQEPDTDTQPLPDLENNFHEEVVREYNNIAAKAGCQKQNKITPKLTELINQRISKTDDDWNWMELETWKSFFVYVIASDYLCGRKPVKSGYSEPFHASLPFLLSNYEAVAIEDRYHDTVPKVAAGGA